MRVYQLGHDAADGIHGQPAEGLVLVEPVRHADRRGYFFESWRSDRYAAARVGPEFVQDNVSVSRRGVLRGLHFQFPHSQAKLVTALEGEIFDVAVDLRPYSATFGRWCGIALSAENGRQLFLPDGFAHGFQVVSDSATVLYKCSRHHREHADHTLRWDDPALAIHWPLPDPELSDRDAAAPTLAELRETLLDGAATPN
jgi:dTDP-4-dehydrorhamnose 3,5-epimerase